MDYNFLSHGGSIKQSNKCVFDSNIGYEADFSVNGEVDGWTYYDGIHTYGCWNNFLFGTLYGSYGVVGRMEGFVPFNADKFHTMRLVMKINLIQRVGSQKYPKYGKLMWRTVADPVFSEIKSYYFELIKDNEWHTFLIDLSNVQWWQGDVNDLRIYPIFSDGRDGDEFFIRVVEVLSVNEFRCLNHSCDYYINYEHNCSGIGERGYCKSKPLKMYVDKGVIFEFSGEKYFDIIEDENDLLLVNINGYGFENVKIKHGIGYTGRYLAQLISRELSRVDIGGYCDCSVEYTEKGEFIITSGTYADDSFVMLGYSKLAVDLGFFDSLKNNISTKHIGRFPASGFLPYSSFKIKTGQVLSIIDSNSNVNFAFNPFIYNVEGGRSDFLDAGFSNPKLKNETQDTRDTGRIYHSYHRLWNDGRTIIDLTHPFNASGRIKKVYVAATLDMTEFNNDSEVGGRDIHRIDKQLYGAKVLFFRPFKNGMFRTLSFELPIENRKQNEGKLYSTSQEFIEIDCDLFVNKGDVIGVYNANILVSKSISGKEIDATYYQIEGKASGVIPVRDTLGEGNGGLLIYARSDQIQNRLVLEIDLGHRINVDSVDVGIESDDDYLEYNIARCLDVNFEVDLFNGDHTTGYVQQYRPTMVKHFFNHPNLYYGKECLKDGIKTVTDGLAADSFSVKYGTYYTSEYSAEGKKNGGAGLIPEGAKYFMVNGDVEWLGIYVQNNRPGHPFDVGNFSRDPIAISMFFPHKKEKLLHKSKIYFKQKSNFRSFSLSTFVNELYTSGTSDDKRFNLIPNRGDGTNTPWKKIVLDGLKYFPEDHYRWDSLLSFYLAENPCTGHIIVKSLTVNESTLSDPNNKYYAPWDSLGGLVYNASGIILNNDQYTRSLSVDWTVIEHEWEPIRTNGFRIHCLYHLSCSICEMELYCIVENSKSPVLGSVELKYSHYDDRWLDTDVIEIERGVSSYVGDTPRYINIIIKPITEVKIRSIDVEVNYEDVFMGEKGCDHSIFQEDARLGHVSPTQVIDFKNVYGYNYDLIVDIASDDLVNNGTVFYSVMNSVESVSNPVLGADSYFKKSPDYKLLNYNDNVAINCPVYALKNLIVGSNSWFSHDYGKNWTFIETIQNQKNINFLNLKNSSITTINVPVITRSKWWKIGFYDPRIDMSVSEARIFYNSDEIEGVKFYHHKEQDVIYGPNSNSAPHLSNDKVDGSYYILKGNHHIGFELPDVQPFDRIVLYNDFLLEHENSNDKAGIDSSTALCIHGDGFLYQTDSIIDHSYYEHSVVAQNSYCDNGFKDDINYSFSEDFSNFNFHAETFDSENIDTSIWTDLVNASIGQVATVSGVVVSGTLNITNELISGNASTVYDFSGDFDVNVSLEVINSVDAPGWGCYLEAFTSNNAYVRVGRSYSATHQRQVFISESFNLVNYETIGSVFQEKNTDLNIRINRVGGFTTCYAGMFGYTSAIGGQSTAIGSSDVRFRLRCIRSPILPPNEVVTAVFDDFYAERSGSSWGINTSNNSSFEQFELNPGVFVYNYNIGCSTSSNAAGYHIPQLFDVQYKPIDNEFYFVFDFSFKAESFLTNTGGSTNSCGVSVGLLESHLLRYSNFYTACFCGAQVMLRRDEIGIVICGSNTLVESKYLSFNTLGGIYFCRFSGDGFGNYNCTVWTDEVGGSNKVLDISLSSNIEWAINKVGVGSGFSPGSTQIYRATGWVSDFNFYCSKKTNNYKISNSSVRFLGNNNSKLIVSYGKNDVCSIDKDGLFFSNKDFTIDFFIKFNSLPLVEGSVINLIKSWDDNIVPVINNMTSSKCSFSLILERTGGYYALKLFSSKNSICKLLLNFNFNPDLHRWYHVLVFRSGYVSSDNVVAVLVNGYVANYTRYTGSNIQNMNYTDYSGSDVVIGENLDGYMEEIRISSDFTSGGCRVEGYTSYTTDLLKPPPVRQYQRYYTISLYNSSDNVTYGKSMDVDVMFDNSFSFHLPFSKWSEKYYSYFAIDLKQRHALEIVRSFPRPVSFEFSLNENVIYSNKEIDNPYEAFSFIHENFDVSNDFSGKNFDHPKYWLISNSPNSKAYLIDNYFYQMCNSVGTPEITYATSEFSFNGDFDFYIDFNINSNQSTSDSWGIGVEIFSLFNNKFALKFEIGCSGGLFGKTLYVRDNSSSWLAVTRQLGATYSGTFRIERNDYIFKVYNKGIREEVSKFFVSAIYQMKNDFGKECKLMIYTYNNVPAIPKVEVWWDNFTVLKANTMLSNSQDARWLMLTLLNGDGVERKINNVGIYSNISKQRNVVGQYNNIWEPLGSSITSYSTEHNIALGATVSGSSSVGYMYFDNIVDGVIGDGDFNLCWGSNSDPKQYVDIHFRQVEPIYRIVIYHGYSDGVSTNLVTNYDISVSTDGNSFSKIFSVVNNTLFKRIHDLPSYVNAKVVRIDILAYKAIDRFVFRGNDDGFGFWKGAVLREVEIYRYYGFSVVNSEDTPIIAVDLKQQYFIYDHSLPGIDSENDTIDWDNSNSNFTWSNSNLSDPRKVVFREWGNSSGYDRWVVIKRNTATKYPRFSLTYPNSDLLNDFPDFLKHVIINAKVDELGNKPNPTEYHWMWRSLISKLSNDYNIISNGFIVSRSLCIDYPASSDVEHVSFVEGDTFGFDDIASWRDSFSFMIHIDNIDNLDLDFGYFYFGGFDYTKSRNQVIYKWNISTVSSVLKSGWNNLNLIISHNNGIEYTSSDRLNGVIGKDVRIPYLINFGKIGFVFRGKGNPLKLNVEGFFIKRTQFELSCFNRDRGLYLHGRDIFKVPSSDITPYAISIEFWIRPDWNFNGKDYYNDFAFRSLFHLGNVSNDILGASVTTNGVEIYYGNLLKDYRSVVIDSTRIKVFDKPTHLAFVFSCDGSGIKSDGSTIRFYINNFLVGKSFDRWSVGDDKHFNFFFGGSGVLVQKANSFYGRTSSVDGVISRLKIHNYCKTDYSDMSIEDNYIYDSELWKPSNALSISKDNVTYHKVGSNDLPFIFKDVKYGESIEIFVKTELPRKLSSFEKRTANIIGSWDIGV